MSFGVFLKSDPSYPVSWGMYSDYGTGTNLMTLPEHRKQGLAFAISASLLACWQSQGIFPVFERHRDTTPYRFGEYIFESTWRDSITGEQYHW